MFSSKRQQKAKFSHNQPSLALRRISGIPMSYCPAIASPPHLQFFAIGCARHTETPRNRRWVSTILGPSGHLSVKRLPWLLLQRVSFTDENQLKMYTLLPRALIFWAALAKRNFTKKAKAEGNVREYAHELPYPGKVWFCIMSLISSRL